MTAESTTGRLTINGTRGRVSIQGGDFTHIVSYKPEQLGKKLNNLRKAKKYKSPYARGEYTPPGKKAKLSKEEVLTHRAIFAENEAKNERLHEEVPELKKAIKDGEVVASSQDTQSEENLRESLLLAGKERKEARQEKQAKWATSMIEALFE